ncbi:STAS domain-containing protein [Catellatospora vulcania]|uniref:STAS domain-containing protein n=1 Tax=Catellatospora vulcania TaxID=1460450 RepID=UPI0018AF8674|nr:STAS domain-containing protein [Catellatospora vulcania]
METSGVDLTGNDPSEAVVAVSGEIDLAVRDDLLDTLHTAIRSAGVARVVVDLSQVSFMDSTGLHVLIAARERAHRSGVGFRVAGATGIVRRVLAVTGVLDLLTGETDADSDEPTAGTPGNATPPATDDTFLHRN